MSGSFRVSVWDPPLIISQIIAVQCFMYVSLGLWTIVLVHMIAGQPLSTDYIFRYQVRLNVLFQCQFHISNQSRLQEVNVKDTTGRLVITSFLMNSLMW